MFTYIVLLILAGIVAMDTTSGPQFLISEPVVSCAALGLLFGRPEMGLMLGMFFQLLWFGYMPLGAVRFTDSNMAALISTASLFISAGIFGFNRETIAAAVIPALFFGVAAGFIGSYFRTYVRRLNSRLSEIMMSRLVKGGELSICRWHFIGVGSSFLRGMLMALVLIPAGTVLCGLTIFLPAAFIKGMALSVPMIWGTACASAVIVCVLKGNKKPLLVGAVGGILWVLMIISRTG